RVTPNAAGRWGVVGGAARAGARPRRGRPRPGGGLHEPAAPAARAASSRCNRSRSRPSLPGSTPPAVTIASVSSERTLADRDLEIGRRAGAQQLQIDAGADTVGSEEPHDLTYLHDRLAVPRGDDIADH